VAGNEGVHWWIMHGIRTCMLAVVSNKQSPLGGALESTSDAIVIMQSQQFDNISKSFFQQSV
jgi:hypothetical protein